MQEVRRLATLAWPVVVGQLGTMALSVEDLVMVGPLGDEAMAALSLGNTWSMMLVVLGMGTLMGLDPLFAQAHGAGEAKAVGRTLLRALVLSQLLALPLTALHFLAEPALRALGQPEAVLPVAGAYCDIVGLSMPPLMAFLALRGFLQALGLMRPAAVVIVLANLLNVALNQAFIYGAPGLEPMGPLGCGWATLLVRVVCVPVLLWLVWEQVAGVWPGWRGQVTRASLRAMLAVGVPVGVQSATEFYAFSAVVLLMGLLGPAAVAGNAIALNVSSLTFMVPMGIGAAAATRVGNLIGADAPWQRAAWTAVAMGAGVMAVSATALALLPAPLARLFTDDAGAVAVAAAVLPVAAAFQLFDGVQVVAFGVLRGAGDTRVPALANAVGYWVLGLPLGAWLCFRADLGPRGVWVGLAVALAVVALLLVLRLRWLVRRGGFRLVEVTA